MISAARWRRGSALADAAARKQRQLVLHPQLDQGQVAVADVLAMGWPMWFMETL